MVKFYYNYKLDTIYFIEDYEVFYICNVFQDILPSVFTTKELINSDFFEFIEEVSN